MAEGRTAFLGETKDALEFFKRLECQYLQSQTNVIL